MKKILFVNSNKIWGGGEKWFFENAIRASKDYKVYFLVDSNSELNYKIEDGSIEKISIKNITNLSGLNLFKIVELYSKLKNSGIEIAIVNSSKDLKLISVVAILLKIKVIFRRGSDVVIKNKFINRILYGKVVEKVIANSKSTYNTIINSLPILENKSLIIYNGIVIPKIDNNLKTNNEKFVVANLGRMVEQKNQKDFIELADSLKDYSDIEFWLGGDGKLRENLQKLALKKGLKNISFLGDIKDIMNFYSNIDLFVLTSKWEGFGFVVAEAMSYKKPVIAYNVSNISELVLDKKNGFLVNFGKIDGLKDRVLFFYNNRDELENFGEFGHKFVMKRFDFNQQYKKLKRAIEEL